MKQFSYYLQYLAARSLIAVFHILPRQFFYFLAPGVARILFLIPQIGKITMMNLRAAFPEKTEAERKKIAVGSMKHLFLTICELFWSKGRRGIIQELVENPPEVNEMIMKGHDWPVKGTIFFAPHLGNWEFAGMALALIYRYPTATVVRSPQNPYLNKLISSGRMVDGVEIVYSKGAVRGMYSALKQGKSVGVLIDQNTRISEGGVFVNFFGLPVPVSMAPAMLARKDNRFVSIGSAIRQGKRFVIRAKTLSRLPAEYASDEELTQELMKLTEELVRENPEQYLWMYKRFQNIPFDIPEELKAKYPPYAKHPRKRFFKKGTPDYERAEVRKKNEKR